MTAESGSDLITEDEFDALLDELDAQKAKEPAAHNDADLITEEEFDALLDELDAQKAKEPAAHNDADLITEEEFDELLDELDAQKAKEPAADNDADLITEEEFDELLDVLEGQNAGQANAPAPSAGTKAIVGDYLNDLCVDADAAEPTATDSTLILPDDLCIASVGELHGVFVQAVRTPRDVRLDAGGVESIDTAGIQLLFSLVREIEAHGKRVTWSGTASIVPHAEALGLAESLGVRSPAGMDGAA